MSTLPSSLIDQMKSSRPILIIFGVLLIVSGLLFVTFTGIATLTSVYLFGLLMIFAGILQAIMSMSALNGGHRWLWLLFSLLYILAGFFAFKAPLATASALTWLIAAFILLGGIFRIVSAFQLRMVNGWGWVLFSGILLFATGLLIAFNPTSPLWLLGLMLGLDLLFQGINLLILSFAIKKL
ncbi:HdeD family acid-resistance protein [Acinetobacter rudis]|uniref:HdeD family acid-resistance protein n=1 Tax=Acinetobacter rudis TaxID=632955 RepID=UPI00280C4E39|nr:HdeD family acid-resistance protein [Acinetobacter rudis]MDQ8954160.1 HdeD family acid-resistance protein [Acinetobacter rudis]